MISMSDERMSPEPTKVTVMASPLVDTEFKALVTPFAGLRMSASKFEELKDPPKSDEME
jgi:hypothetical protein